MKRYALFPCLGLGDALISLIIAHNLTQNQHLCDTYHPSIWQMESLFPNLSLHQRPPIEKLPASFAFYDELIFFFEKKPWMHDAIAVAKKWHRGKIRILNPIATPNRDYPFWEEGKFDGSISFVKNLARFCRNELHLPNVVETNGLAIPKQEKDPSFVVIHPTSSRRGKNWSPSKFLSLANILHKKGYRPSFIVDATEKHLWQIPFLAPSFDSLKDVAHYISSAAAFIGNDSGIGHLASSLAIPTVTICRSKMTASFWHPDFAPYRIITPPRWLPNIKGCRLRDKHWQWFICTRHVLRHFVDLLAAQENVEDSTHMRIEKL